MSFYSCKDDNDSPHDRVTNFTVPELDSNNTIQFTVNATNNVSCISLLICGKKVAVDWGDGSEIEKDDLTQNRGADYDYRETFSHSYSTNDVYTIKIWSTEVTELSLSANPVSEFYSFGDLEIGSCPILEKLHLGYFDMEELIFKSNTPNLIFLSLHGFGNIKILDINSLSNLETLYITDLSKLEDLNVSQNRKLWELNCSNLPKMKSIDLANNTGLIYLSLLNCAELTNVDLSGTSGLTNLHIDRTPLSNMDLSQLKELSTLSCRKINVNTIDVSKNPKLYALSILENELATLDVTQNVNLAFLICTDNKLTALDVSNNTMLELLDVANNKLSASELDVIFTNLPRSKYVTKTKAVLPPSAIVTVYGNPGASECNDKIITDKGWRIVKQ